MEVKCKSFPKFLLVCMKKVYSEISYTHWVKQFTLMNKFVSGGLEQMQIILLNLTFSHDFTVKVYHAYYRSVRIIFEFLW